MLGSELHLQENKSNVTIVYNFIESFLTESETNNIFLQISNISLSLFNNLLIY